MAEPLDAAGGVRRMERFAARYVALDAFTALTIAVCVGHGDGDGAGAGAELAAGCERRVGGDNLSSPGPARGWGVPVGPAA